MKRNLEDYLDYVDWSINYERFTVSWGLLTYTQSLIPLIYVDYRQADYSRPSPGIDFRIFFWTFNFEAPILDVR